MTVGGPEVEHFDGNVTLSVNHSAVFDAAGNQMTSTGYQVQGYAMLDNTGPTVTSIQRQVDAGNDTGMFDYDGVTNSDQLVWTVNTSEPIAPGTLTGADFALTGITPTSTPTITVVTDTGAGYGSNDSQFTVTVSGGGLASADQAGIGLALSAGSSFADIAGNLADSTADDASAYNETYTLDNTPLGAPGASLTTDTGATAGHTSDEAVTVTAAAESYGVRYSLDGSSFVSDPGSLPFSETEVTPYTSSRKT